MKRLVVDASVAVKWVVDEPGSSAAAELADADLAAPELLLAECANVLWVKHRRGEISREHAQEGLELLRRAPVLLVPHRDLIATALALAFDLRQTVYDCLYLALASEQDAELVTVDERFSRAVRASAVDSAAVERVRLLEP